MPERIYLDAQGLNGEGSICKCLRRPIATPARNAARLHREGKFRRHRLHDRLRLRIIRHSSPRNLKARDRKLIIRPGHDIIVTGLRPLVSHLESERRDGFRLGLGIKGVICKCLRRPHSLAGLRLGRLHRHFIGRRDGLGLYVAAVVFANARRRHLRIVLRPLVGDVAPVMPVICRNRLRVRMPAHLARIRLLAFSRAGGLRRDLPVVKCMLSGRRNNAARLEHDVASLAAHITRVAVSAAGRVLLTGQICPARVILRIHRNFLRDGLAADGTGRLFPAFLAAGGFFHDLVFAKYVRYLEFLDQFDRRIVFGRYRQRNISRPDKFNVHAIDGHDLRVGRREQNRLIFGICRSACSELDLIGSALVLLTFYVAVSVHVLPVIYIIDSGQGRKTGCFLLAAHAASPFHGRDVIRSVGVRNIHFFHRVDIRRHCERHTDED